MALLGTIDIDGNLLGICDAVPSVSGISLPVGSILFLNTGGIYVKTGATDTDWGTTPVSAPGGGVSLNDAALTGSPTCPNKTAGDSTTAIANTAFVTGAISDLVNGAGASLNTLNELAAALGNDANYATTVTTALGLKAPLASPTFTGSPAAPTATAGDSSTLLATTAFVTTADNLKVDKTTTLTAGTGIATIGDLSANRTIAMADMAANTFKGNNTGSSAAPVDLTVAQAKTLLAITLTSDVIGTLQAGQFPALTGDVTTTAGALTSTIAASAVTYAKIQDVSADKILGRSTAGAGVVEEIACTAAGRALIDDASAAAQATTLGLGTTDSPTFQGLNIVGTGMTENISTATVDTTNATVTTAATLVTVTDTVELVEVYVNARRTSGGVLSASYIRRARLQNAAGVLTVNGLAAEFTNEGNAALDCTITVSGVNALVRVTGIAATNITWNCLIKRYK
jgi:hypothetical protein